jgi:hypothetical protein
MSRLLMMSILLWFVHCSIEVFAEDASCGNNKSALLISEDFSAGSQQWTPTDKTAWKLKAEDDHQVYALIKKKSNYEPPVRSPYNRAILKDVVVSDFVMEVKFRSTIPDYNHRSLCLFFGYQDESHFYYVHFGKKTDDHANQIFIVNEKPRTKISTKTTPGTPWDDEWHHARIERSVKTGEIKVYFDDMKTPVMTATDKTFAWGQIGIGSFDDTGDFATVKLWGEQVEKE